MNECHNYIYHHLIVFESIILPFFNNIHTSRQNSVQQLQKKFPPTNVIIVVVIMSETAQEFDEETRKCIELSRKRLEPLVSKIPLQDKHLARPPVAFLKALVLCLVRERGYPEGLFDEEFLKTKKDLTVSLCLFCIIYFA